MIRRETGPDFLDRIVADPDVIASFGTVGIPQSFAPLFEHPDGYRMYSDGVGFGAVFEWSAPGVWQSHTMALPNARGKDSIEAAKAIVAEMLKTERMLWGMTPASNRAAIMFNRLIGAKYEGDGTDASGQPVKLFTVEK